MNRRRYGSIPILAAIAALVPLRTSAQPAPPPVLTKAFSPTTISPGETTVLTFTLSNGAGNPAESNVGFTDTLPSGLVIADNTVGGTCANAAAATLTTAGGNTITVTSLQVPAGEATCTVTVNVTNAENHFNAACAANPAGFTNAAANVTASNVENSIQPSCVVVTPPVSPSVPALSGPTLGLLGAALAAAALWSMRR
jgi:uncharacterized repeat protein (TIGR01451 family)